jgi:hypothetical protein
MTTVEDIDRMSNSQTSDVFWYICPRMVIEAFFVDIIYFIRLTEIYKI